MNPVKPVETVNLKIRENREEREVEEDENEKEEPSLQEEALEQLRRKVEGYYGLEAGKVEIKFQGR